MTQLSRLAFIGNSLPRRCGIATFTTDLQQAVSTSRADVETCIVAMTDHGHAYDYPPVVRLQINDDRIEDYVRAADVPECRPVRRRFPPARIRHFRRRSRRPHHGAAVAADHADRHDASYGSFRADAGAARRLGPDHRRVVEGRRHGRERPGAAAHASIGCRRKRSRSSRTGFPTSPSSSPTRRRPNSASAARPSF